MFKDLKLFGKNFEITDENKENNLLWKKMLSKVP